MVNAKITGESKNVEYYGYWEWKDGKIIATGGILDPTWYGGEIVRYLESQNKIKNPSNDGFFYLQSLGESNPCFQDENLAS